MASDKQIEANRINSQKSTGPITEEGKAKVAKNSTRYRRLAETVLMKAENPKAFQAWARRFYLDLRPEGPMERALLDAMLTARWKLMRASTLETAAVDREYDQLRNPTNATLSIPERASLAFNNLHSNSRAQHAMGTAEARLQRQFDSAYDRLMKSIERRRIQAKSMFEGVNQ